MKKALESREKMLPKPYEIGIFSRSNQNSLLGNDQAMG